MQARVSNPIGRGWEERKWCFMNNGQESTEWRWARQKILCRRTDWRTVGLQWKHVEWTNTPPGQTPHPTVSPKLPLGKFFSFHSNHFGITMHVPTCMLAPHPSWMCHNYQTSAPVSPPNQLILLQFVFRFIPIALQLPKPKAQPITVSQSLNSPHCTSWCAPIPSISIHISTFLVGLNFHYVCLEDQMISSAVSTQQLFPDISARMKNLFQL